MVTAEEYLPSEVMVREFREVFDQPIPDTPCKPSEAIFYSQLKLINEELQEVEKALTGESLEAYFKELCDLQYVVDQLIVASGMCDHKEAGMIAIHTSNMSKVNEDGTVSRREDGKVLKGTNYKPVTKEQLNAILNS